MNLKRVVLIGLGALSLALIGILTWPGQSQSAYADGTSTIVVNSISRVAATGNFKWDLTVTASGYWSSNGTNVCVTGSTCDWFVEAEYPSGSTVRLQDVSLRDSATPVSYGFTGSAWIPQVSPFAV